MDPFGAVQTALPWAEFQPALLNLTPDPPARILGYFPDEKILDPDPCQASD